MTTADLLLRCWRPDALALGVGVLATVAFAKLRRGASERLGAPTARDACFGLALVTLLLALASPIGQLAEGYLFSAHMLQHLLLVLVVPPLALLGLGVRGTPGAARRFEALAAWALGVGAMWLWHERTLCNAAALSPAVHRLQEISL